MSASVSRPPLIRLRAVLATAVLATGVASTAFAQAAYIGVSGGASIPVARYGPSDVELNTGWTTSLLLRVDAREKPFGLEIMVGYSSRPPQSGVGVVENYHTTLSGIWRIGKPKALQPYAMAGLGVDYYQDALQNGITVGLDGGAGVAFGSGQWQPLVEGRYHWTFTKGSDLRTVMLVGGVRYRL